MIINNIIFSEILNLETINIDSLKTRAKLNIVSEKQAEPFGGVTVIGFDYLYQRAAELEVKVLLDGNGIDESFMGYDKYWIKGRKANFNLNIDGSNNSLGIDFLNDDFKNKQPI